MAGLATSLAEVPLDQIREGENMRAFRTDDEHGRGLVESVRKIGVLGPILLRPLPKNEANGHRYELVAGFRRFSAACEAGLKSVPARIIKVNEAEGLMARLTENIQRLDANPIEEAAAISRYISLTGAAQRHVAGALGKSETWISHRLALLELPDRVRSMISEGAISPSAAEILLEIPHEEQALMDRASKLARERMSLQGLRQCVRQGLYSKATGRDDYMPAGQCGAACACTCSCCEFRRRKTI
ncbi:MAG: ParB/RepB/Spo0J family partition protein [Euryarchaeota archaeon]|nr:ParB/RepB/Spo0J family partition protein [Euryarchaeota archaeon]MDE1881585.1 ParB/RepB/Spo0J family partition protein [Euryarchaeota archaeon]